MRSSPTSLDLRATAITPSHLATATTPLHHAIVPWPYSISPRLSRAVSNEAAAHAYARYRRRGVGVAGFMHVTSVGGWRTVLADMQQVRAPVMLNPKP